MKDNQIKCPHCNHIIDINSVLVENILQDERKAILKEVREQINKENAKQLKTMQDELNEKSKQISELKNMEAENARLKRENAEAESKIKAKMETQYSKSLENKMQEIKKKLESEWEQKLKEKDEQLKTIQKEAESLKQKTEQGSMQTQGEALESLIYEYLENKFRFDNIENIKQGQNGADILQTIHTREMQNCGKIYYEIKNTKVWQNAWIDKFKADIKDKRADIGVLVTNTKPKEMERIGIEKGIWICSYDEFKSLCLVLRECLVEIARLKNNEENKNDKINLLYNYLTSKEFSDSITNIIETFTKLKTALDKEKKSMNKIWKEREMQLEIVLNSTTNMYGSLKGIAGNSLAIPHIKALEFDEEE